MTNIITLGQLSILLSLRDGDDPLMRAPEDELIFYKRDLALLTVFGFVVREGGRLVLTGLGERELESPASKAAFAEVLVDCFEVGRVTPDPMALEAPRGTEHK